jgi:hypothetical protein
VPEVTLQLDLDRGAPPVRVDEPEVGGVAGAVVAL